MAWETSIATVYRTKDGKIFETKTEAVAHERRLSAVNELMNIAGFDKASCYEAVAEWILSNLDEINKLVKE